MAKTLPITLDNEVNDLLTKSKEFIMPEPTLIIHTEDGDVTIVHFNSIDVERNYTTNLSDIIYVNFNAGLGFASKVLYKHRDKLEATVKLKFSNKKIQQRRFKFVLMTKFEDIHDSSMSKISQEDLDTQDYIEIKAQCIDTKLLKFKNEYVEGIFHDMDLRKVMKNIFSKKMREAGTDSYINVYVPKNVKSYENIFIEPFTKFVRLPFIFQNDKYGLYDHGAGIYFSNISEASESKYDVDIFPIFDYERFDAEAKRPKLIIINPTKSHMSKHEIDFYYKDGIYKSLVSNVKFQHDSEDKRYDTGNGFIIEDSGNTINQSLLDIKDDIVKYANDQSFSITKLDETRSYNNLVETGGDDNLYKYNSTLNRLQGVIGSVMLPKVNPEIIYPGMPFKYMFNKDGKVASTTGVVQGLQYSYDFINKTTVVMLVCIFKRLIKE